jgi:hypothetical protein
LLRAYTSPNASLFLLQLNGGCKVLMESPLIANGAEISRIGGFVKIEKIERKVQAPRASVKCQYFCKVVSNEAEVV